MAFVGEINAVDAHAAGAPGRVVIGGVGVLDVPGATMFEKKQFLEQQRDWFRKLMLKEPRGYPGMCVNLVLPPTHPEADAGFVIMEQPPYYPPMSGSNTMCVVTVLLETGVLPLREPVTHLTLETPAGLIRVRADCANGRVTQVTFENVPAFATHLDVPLEVRGLGTVQVDIAYGGMFYILADATKLGLRITPDEGRDISRLGEQIKTAAREQISVAHPENPAINRIENALLYGPPHDPRNSGRNAVVITTGAFDWERPSTWAAAIDRCPCGTGTCARMAVLHAKGQLPLERDYRHEGILDTVFTGRLLGETRVGPYPAVIPQISGRAWITGYARYVLAADDPFPEGFTLGDIWPPSRVG